MMFVKAESHLDKRCSSIVRSSNKTVCLTSNASRVPCLLPAVCEQVPIEKTTATNKRTIFRDESPDTALLSNSGKMAEIFGYPSVSLEQMIKWQAEWILQGGRSLGKPTHFEEKKGDY